MGYEEDLIMNFLKTIECCGVTPEQRIEYWEDYKKYELKRKTAVIIADPSNHYGIVKYNDVDVDEENSWKRYSLNRKLKLSWKKMGRIYFNGYFYNLAYLITAIPIINAQEYEIKQLIVGGIHGLSFKIDDTYCLSFGELIHAPYEVKNDGVWFLDEIYDDDTDDFTEVNREFVKWNRDGVAIREPGGRSRGMKDYLYDWRYWFDEIEEFGGFMML